MDKHLNHDIDKVCTLLELASRGVVAYLSGNKRTFDMCIQGFAKAAEGASASLAIRELDKEQLPLL